jgi:hypothetical protein
LTQSAVYVEVRGLKVLRNYRRNYRLWIRHYALIWIRSMSAPQISDPQFSVSDLQPRATMHSEDGAPVIKLHSTESIQATAASFIPGSQIASWRRYVNALIGAEVSSFSRYFDKLIQVEPLPNDSGALFRSIDCPQRGVTADLNHFPDLTEESEERTVVLLNGNLNHDLDIQSTLRRLRVRLARTARVVLVAYNPYLKGLYTLANMCGIRKGAAPQTFVTRTDIDNIAKISGFELVGLRPVAFFPWRLGGLGDLINRALPLVPVLGRLSFASVVVLRPVIASKAPPSLSIIIPARNEKGNIEAALQRMPNLGAKLEIVFVEGHSQDGTWEEIQRVASLYSDRFSIKCLQQTGKGKADAVRLGFGQATGDLLTILDADLTMPPELLGRFYDVYRTGLSDFVNGSRLVYPMEGEAMRFLNRLGNVFFAKSLSIVMGTRIGDSLCGTKLVSRHDYLRMTKWRQDFGDFDPFGDFELLFPAAVLTLGIVDVPVRYRARTYGSTNIRRFRDGWRLLKMTVAAFFKLRLGSPLKGGGVEGGL